MVLGKTYRAKADYSVFVPLEMEEGFTIIYRDSTNSMEDDLKDYTAEGIQLKTIAENTIPLDLTLSVTASPCPVSPSHRPRQRPARVKERLP